MMSSSSTAWLPLEQMISRGFVLTSVNAFCLCVLFRKSSSVQNQTKEESSQKDESQKDKPNKN